MNPDKLLTLLMGRCWHDWDVPANDLPTSLICNKCKTVGTFFRGHGIEPPNPSFSDPRHRDEFFTWLCRERGEMWEMFLPWALRQYEHPWAWEGKTISWLFFQSPSRPRDLMAEWLQLPETVERFGMIDCELDGDAEDCDNCSQFGTDCSGRVLSAWAQYVREGTI